MALLAAARALLTPGAAPRRLGQRGLSTTCKEAAGHCTLSLHSWFFKPAFGMKDYEILGRASGILTARRDGALTVLTSLHNVDPASLPHYCGPEDGPTAWMHHVRPDEVKIVLQVLDESGSVLDELEMKHDAVSKHESRDLAAVDFENDNEARAFLEKHALVPFDFASSAMASPEPGDEVLCHGQTVEPRMEDDQDVSKSMPARIGGIFAINETLQVMAQGGVHITAPQILVATSEPLEPGMCGGAVQATGGLVGMIEGILTPELAERLELPQLTAVIPASELADFVATLPNTNSTSSP
ncbi:Hypothetical Protein FCC1311_057362 [Hondaea fermentalgiana]|uniref:Uncharacterized protein n=1 Tax=Hondaea fermentalgiana TaxID=2315210 RepID=A0A2R5GFZ9_9STRA|nr:Hypothetical Protein FCC1311_057362 [Hondaea fermentalgiana]|eukprot:GBG29515.1 Hypothetical Protein FCC1311_057362 [Hondaea fermentalgiana]